MANITIAPSKMQQILEAGRKQLSPEEIEEMETLLFDLGVYGLTPWINVKLGTLMAKIQWELDVGESREWAAALQACDYAFLGTELREMCRDTFISPVGHKKRLCARLFKKKVPAVMTVMEPYLKELSPERIKEDIEREALVERLPQTEPLWAEKLVKIKGDLEKLYRIDRDEFYYRKQLIKKAIEERERGVRKTMPELTLEELRNLLKFTNRFYG